MNTSAKVKRLLELIGLDNLGIQATDHGPFALVALGGVVYAVSDEATADEKTYLYQQMQSIEHPTRLMLVTGQEFLAALVTIPRYFGFHDSMAFAIHLPMLYTSGFWGLGNLKPNYRMIQKVLTEAGFKAEFDSLKDDGSGDPEWVQRVHAEQRRNFRNAIGHDMPD